MGATESSRHVLSKSTFIRGCQCRKSLYLYKHYYKTRDPLTPAQRAIFTRGTNVGMLARELFPGGEDASPPTPFQYAQSVRRTADLVASGVGVIYEAAFMTAGVLAAMDILVRRSDGYYAYEVKSSTSISNTYLLDAALQYWVMSGAGVEPADISIVHIDPDYVRRGELDIQRLFRVQSVRDEVLGLQDFVSWKVEELKWVIKERETPAVDIGPHCSDPYPCDFMGTCWQEIPDYSVFDIARLREERKFELYRRGILDVGSVPDDFPLSDRQRLQVVAERTGEAHIDPVAVADFLAQLAFPLYFVDFESFQPAVPLYDGSRPYQQIPFQYSLHVLEEPQTAVHHREYLAEAGPDPRREFLTRLLDDVGTSGSVVVYNRTFEETRLGELAADVPGYEKAIDRLRSRIVDLMVPFRDGSFYTPAMQGSYSIKHVLPALVPELSYAGLDIRDGTQASIAFERLIVEDNRRVHDRVRRRLLAYCKMDSYAMVKIFEVLAREGRRVERVGWPSGG